MNTKWNQKKVLITGGTSGLGRALALELVARGAKVAIVARNRSELDSVIGIQGDVSKKEDIHRIAAEAMARLGGIDLLINNASYLGATPLRLLADTECEDFGQVFETNVIGPFRLTKALLPAMLLQRRGTVLNISSDAAVNPYPGWGGYGASKAALAHLSRIWNEETREYGIEFFAIDPGDMDTPMHAAAVPDADLSTLIKPKDSAIRLLDLITKERSI